MDKTEIIKRIKNTEAPLKRQLMMAALITNLLEQKGKGAPIVIGGCALSYYTREVYFTADIDFAYTDMNALSAVLKEIDFRQEGRYWINEDLKIAVEVPASTLSGEDSPVETVEIEDNFYCKVIGIEDLIIDRLNSCKYWKSAIDCEMVELLIRKYLKELDWPYLEKKADIADNNVLEELRELRKKAEK